MLFFLPLIYKFKPITLKQNKMARPRQLKNKVLTLRAEGKSYRAIQKELNCSRGTINYHCKDNDLTDIGMKVHPLTNELKTQIAEFCQNNTSAKASEQFGLSLSTIKKYRKYQG
jgi:DNA-binding CsgD family transcriptional regulator